MARQSGGISTIRPGAIRTRRGSHKRLRRIKMTGNWSVEFLVTVLAIALSLLFLIPWLIETSRNSGSPPSDTPRGYLVPVFLIALTSRLMS